MKGFFKINMTTTDYSDSNPSPMMAQWHSCKKNAPGSLLFFRLGDFYEAFYDDAILMAKELDLTLTKRQEIPMCGVPFHTSEAYVDKLVSKGYRVAIAEQMENPRDVKGIVKREVVRIVTPGTVVNSTLLTDKTNNFITAITQVNCIFGIAVLDLTTAEFSVMELEDEKQLMDELFRLKPSELLVSEKCEKHHSSLIQELRCRMNCALTINEEWRFDHRNACDMLLKHFKIQNLDGFGLKGMLSAINAAGALLQYVHEDLSLKIDHITHIRRESLGTYLSLDLSTQRHLELVEPLHAGQNGHTLLHLLDRTQTPMGGRQLKNWLLHPLLCPIEINLRQDTIEAYLSHAPIAAQIGSHLKNIRDLERLIMRIETGFAGPRDLVSLRFSLEQIPLITKLLHPIHSELIHQDLQKLADTSEITAIISHAIVDAPPFRLNDGGIIKAGYHQELDELRSIHKDHHAWIAQYQVKIREETGAKTLKIGFTKAFGYYIEVSRGQSDKIPDSFQKRQTLVNAERFITPELKEYEHKLLNAESGVAVLENELFHKVRLEIARHSLKIREIAQAVARIDCLIALSETAKEHHYIRPVVDNSDLFHIEESRHPVLEAALSGESFIPNDIFLDNQNNRLILITGPNMAGKSTFIRQAALIAIMAQMGSFIPAKKGHIGIIDKVFSRIGASDDLARGQSTFMVEMAETANILNNATSRSLVILDEIGRGTSTYDGISIAWAVAEYLFDQ